MSKHISFLLSAGILVLNYIDYMATKFWLVSGVATEANPIMVKAIESGNFEVKLISVPLTLLFLLAVRSQKEKLVDCGLYTTTVCYVALNIYHAHIYLTTNALYPSIHFMLFPIGLS
jgi:hypothetical protein